MHYLTKVGVKLINETPIIDDEGRVVKTQIDPVWRTQQLTSRHSAKKIKPAIRQADKTRKRLEKGAAKVPFKQANRLVTMAYKRGYAGGKGVKGPNVPGGRGMKGILQNLGTRSAQENVGESKESLDASRPNFRKFLRDLGDRRRERNVTRTKKKIPQNLKGKALADALRQKDIEGLGFKGPMGRG